MKSALILYPNQLYSVSSLPKTDYIVMVEEPLFFGMDQEFPMRMHKQKLVFLRASMRRYVEEVLWPADKKVDYIDLDVFMQTADIFAHVKKAEQIYVIDTLDERLNRRLIQARRQQSEQTLEFVSNPNFLLSEVEAREFFSAKHKQPFNEFYQWQRERFNVLLNDDYKPSGGKWILETSSSDLKDTVPPGIVSYGDNKHVEEAKQWVAEHFPNAPGGSDLIWPTSHKEAENWLNDFIKNRLHRYGDFLNNINADFPWLFHSLLGSSLNSGLLSPKQVLDAVFKSQTEHPVNLANLEPFVRHILGWREYQRAYYLNASQSMLNPYNNNRKLAATWYNAQTGLIPLDNLIKKLSSHGYASYVECRQIACNLMILSEINPADMYKWFNELLIDSADWNTKPFIEEAITLDGAGFNEQLSIMTSSGLIEQGAYHRDIWSDIWDGLYWRFIEKHKTSLSHKPKFRPIVQRLNRLDSDRKRVIHYRAEDFLSKNTNL